VLQTVPVTVMCCTSRVELEVETVSVGRCDPLFRVTLEGLASTRALETTGETAVQVDGARKTVHA